MKLNLGCGRNPMEGFVNIDRASLPGVDVVCDLETASLPFDDGTVTEIVGVDLIEHITNAMGLMAELWRVAAPDATCTFVLPYGSSDDAWEDPTHVRPYFIGSWMYFAQPTYFRADYGYRADWLLTDLILEVGAEHARTPPKDLMRHVQTFRNIVHRQVATLTAVKPARPCDRSLMTAPPVRFQIVR